VPLTTEIDFRKEFSALTTTALFRLATEALAPVRCLHRTFTAGVCTDSTNYPCTSKSLLPRARNGRGRGRYAGREVRPVPGSRLPGIGEFDDGTICQPFQSLDPPRSDY